MPIIGGDLKIRSFLMPNSGLRGQMKHESFAYNPADRRLYCGSGDYFYPPIQSSYQRAAWSTAIDGAFDWREEVGTCPPTPDAPWNRGRCQAAFVIDQERNVAWLAGGNYVGMNNFNGCGVPADKLNSAFVMGLDLEHPRWFIPKQSPAVPEKLVGSGIEKMFKYGCWDEARKRIVSISGHNTMVEWHRDTGQWDVVETPRVGFLWQRGDFCRAGRLLYMIDEVGGHLSGGRPGLMAFDLGRNRTEFVDTLPVPPRPHGSYEVTNIVYWEARDTLVYYRSFEKNVVYFRPFSSGKWERHTLIPPEPESPILTRNLLVAGDALIFYGRNDIPWGDPRFFDYHYWVIH
ncbi:MAG: hypothetical protein B7Z66_08055 [Chromatiales bacterium 21-64-14]|nr:MAG: hypothetical protein B7Z66_08055 [Chromatiales bacterium 21-64-14]HQU16066.1 hypothetical protein [Gammaproteobacteria bacterium]